MNTKHQADDRFDRNLRIVAANASVPMGPDADTLERCFCSLEHQTSTPNWRMTVQTYRKPILWSTMGMAAAFALFATALWPSANPKVHAALVVEKLAKQAQQNPLMELTVENLVVDEVQCTAHLQLGKGGVAGDVNVRVENKDDDMPGAIEFDASLGLAVDGGWILLRRLSIPDPKAQFFVNMLLPPGQETLLVLPKNSEIGDELGANIEEGLNELRSGELIQAFKEIIAAHADLGATLTNQPDGTILLSLPIEDEEALAAIVRVFHKMEGGAEDETHDEPVVVEKKTNLKAHKSHGVKAHAKAHAAHVDHDPNLLVGATVNALYDPATETVRMLEVLGLGSPNAVVRLALRDGDVDPSLLDSTRVAKPGVRILDFGAIEAIIKSFEHSGDRE